MPDPSGEFDAGDADRYPDEWLEAAADGTHRLRQNFRRYRPIEFAVGTLGKQDGQGLTG